MLNTTVLGANDEYVQQTTLYGRKDALYAIVLYIVAGTLFLLLGKIFVSKGSSLTGIFTFLATGTVSLVCIGLFFLICFIQKQKLETVGFSKRQIKKSFEIGIVLFVPVLILRGIGIIFSTFNIQTDIVSLIMKIIYNLIFIALMEEILIRGFIGTRLYGYFKNKRLSIILVGIMWSVYHIPFYMIVTRMDMLEYISVNWGKLFCIFILHFAFQWLYSKNNSLIAPTILHFIIDFS